MIKKATAVCLIILTVFLTLTSCGKSKEIIPIMSISSDPMCFDPQATDNDNAKNIIYNCFEGLVRLDENYNIVPGVAESWDISDDGLQYTFHLSEKSKWQLQDPQKKLFPKGYDFSKFGTVVTAADFEFALKRAISPETECSEAEKLFIIENAEAINNGKADISTLGVKAEGNNKLIIRLCQKNEDLLRLLTLPFAMPCKEEFFNLTHAKYGLGVRYTLCNGAYYIRTWLDDNYVTLGKVKEYSGSIKAKAASIYFYVNEDNASACEKVIQHSYDAAYVDSENVNIIDSNDNVKRVGKENVVYGLCLNCKSGILTNKNLRMALFSATKIYETEKIEGCSSVAEGLVPLCCRYGGKSYRDVAGNVRMPQYNEKEALRLWLKGLKEEELPKTEIRIICPSGFTETMQKVIQVWQRVFGTSITAKVTETEKEEISKNVESGNYVAAVTDIKADSAAVCDFLKIFTTGNKLNLPGYSNVNFDNSISSIYKEKINPVSEYKRLEQMLIDECIFYPIGNFSESVVFNKEINGMYMLPAGEGIIMTGSEK